MTPDGVINYVGQQIEGAAAGGWFKRNYNDVWSDDELSAQANKLDTEMLQESAVAFATPPGRKKLPSSGSP